jgi:hypothetical protein
MDLLSNTYGVIWPLETAHQLATQSETANIIDTCTDFYIVAPVAMHHVAIQSK